MGQLVLRVVLCFGAVAVLCRAGRYRLPRPSGLAGTRRLAAARRAAEKSPSSPKLGERAWGSNCALASQLGQSLRTSAWFVPQARRIVLRSPRRKTWASLTYCLALACALAVSAPLLGGLPVGLPFGAQEQPQFLSRLPANWGQGRWSPPARWSRSKDADQPTTSVALLAAQSAAL